MNIIKVIIFLIMISNVALGQVLPIAHRGASAYAPENTLRAIQKANELGSPYIEIDVHMTKDGEVVAIHDPTVDRTSNGSGDAYDFTLKQIKGLDFGLWFGVSFKDERVPTLEEVLKLIGDNSKLIIELKYGGDQYPQIENKIISTVKRLDRSDSVILKSFSYEILNKFERLAPGIERLYCTFWGNSWLTIDNFFRFKGIFEKATFQYLQVHKLFLSKKLIQEAHGRGIKVVVWDVQDKETMREFVKKGVDFIESDNPDYVLDL